jgi:cytoskeletal protein RodZ
MRIKQKKSHKKAVIITIIALLVIAGGVTCWLLLQNKKTDNTVNTNSSQNSTNTDNSTDSNNNTNSSENSTPTNNTTNEKNTTPTETTPDANTTNTTLTATQDGASIIITTNLNNLGSGTCALIITNETSGSSKNYSADVIYQPEFSTCAGFSIPRDDLGVGNWQISLSVSGGNSQEFNKSTALEVQ